MFCVGISTAYSIMNRLDRLMVATKEIVGEQYHIQGMGVGSFLFPGHAVGNGLHSSAGSQYGGATPGAHGGVPLTPTVTIGSVSMAMPKPVREV